MPADILTELLTTALIDQDTNKGRKGGYCSIWFVVFLIALACWIGWMFYGPE